MSIMSSLADEILAPVKTGLYITSAVVVVGGMAVAANSKAGRKFLANVKDAVTATKPEDKPKMVEQKGEVIDVEAIEDSNTSYDDHAVNLTEPDKKLIGEQNV